MPPGIEPDTKDWTWVLERACPDCGFDPAAAVRGEIADRVRRNADLWPPLLAAPGVGERPDPATWSVLEYACHVRDVHRVFGPRLTSMLEGEDPLFADWDQDATALEGRYGEQHPARVAEELVAAAEDVARLWASVPDDAWARPGRRSNGSVFTVETLGRYQLHDLEHHAWDVREAVSAATSQAYDDDVVAYASATSTLHGRVRERLDDLVAALGPGARVLEIGSGAGRDALHLEEQGLLVRRTDVSAGFVALLRDAGHDAERLDPLHDDLLEPGGGAPYDAVWANASLLHVARSDLPVVLGRLAAVTRRGGVLAMSVKEGDGERWSVHGSVRAPRRFVLWREDPLRAVLTAAGWHVTGVRSDDGLRGDQWLSVAARRGGLYGGPGGMLP